MGQVSPCNTGFLLYTLYKAGQKYKVNVSLKHFFTGNFAPSPDAQTDIHINSSICTSQEIINKSGPKNEWHGH